MKSQVSKVSKSKHKELVFCQGNGWADGALAALKYNSNPAKLQALIRQMFVLATKNISLPVRAFFTFTLFVFC